MRWIQLVLGVLLLLLGLVWFFQGIGLLQGSFMTGQIIWAVIGLIAAGLGVLFARNGLRHKVL